MKRVMVIGCPGSGKSTFSRALHSKTGLPLFYLDMMYWNPDRTRVDKNRFLERLTSVLEQEAWIIDGNYHSTIEYRLQKCDTVFFLDYPTEICLQGVRERRGRKRPDMPWTESADAEDAEFLDFIRNYQTRSKPEICALLRRYPEKKVYIFSSRKEADAFLRGLT